MPSRWFDFSSHNDPTARNLNDWRGLGFDAGIPRLLIGTNLDTSYLQHRSNLRLAGYKTGAYAALHEAASMITQCRLFISNLPEDDELPPWADIERPGLTWRMVAQWIDTWEQETDGRELWIYTGKSAWESIMHGSDVSRYAHYPLVIAAYPFDRSDYDENGNWRGQLMDAASIALRSNPPVNRQPALPAPWTEYRVWQHTGHGRLPGYNRDLDMSIGELPVTFPSAWTKLGPHHLMGGGDTGRWLREAIPTVAKFVDDFGVANEAPIETLTVGRRVDDGAFNGQGFDANLLSQAMPPMQAARMYADWLGQYILLNPRIQVWEGPNEQVITTPAVMAWYAHFGYEFARLIRTEYNRRAGLGSWSVGHPLRELNLWPHYVWALQATRDQKAVLTRHEYGPMDGFMALRYRYDQSVFSALGYPEVPVIITECGTDFVGGIWSPWKIMYNGDAERYWQEWLLPYIREIEKDRYCLGATLFSVGLWRDFDVDGTVIPQWVIDHSRTVRVKTPPLEKIMQYLITVPDEYSAGDIIAALGNNLVDFRAIIPVEAVDWWERPVPFTTLAVANPLTLYKSVGGPVDRVMSNVTWDIVVVEQVSDWLRVTGASTPGSTGLWAKAQDLKLKPA